MTNQEGTGTPPPPPEYPPPATPETPAPVTPAPVTPAPVTPAPVTPAAPAPVDPAPIPASPAPPAGKKPSTTTIAIIVAAVVVVGAAIAGYFMTKDADRVAPAASEVTAAFVPIEGYEYVEMPADSLEPLRQAFSSTAAQEAVAHFDARQLTKDGTTEAVVFILSIDPDEMKGNFEDQYTTGFTATSQATVEDFAIGDITGHIAETPMGTIAYFFDLDGYAFNVVGRDRPTIETITNALYEGNS